MPDTAHCCCNTRTFSPTRYTSYYKWKIYSLQYEVSVSHSLHRRSEKLLMHCGVIYLQSIHYVTMLSVAQVMQCPTASLLNNALERMWKKWLWPNITYRPSFSFEGPLSHAFTISACLLPFCMKYSTFAWFRER